MSASISKYSALNFNGNVFFEIKVEDNPRIEHYDHGYAFLEEISSFKDEEEVIFNSMNIFKILKIKKNLS